MVPIKTPPGEARVYKHHRKSLNVTAVPVAIFCKAVLYPGFSFGLRGEQSIHLHHEVAGPERAAAMNSQSTMEKLIHKEAEKINSHTGPPPFQTAALCF